MGRWRDGEDDRASERRRGFGDIGEISGGGEMCSTRRTVKSSCRTEEVEPGRFIRKCDKTEQVLRECAGRPVEVVESNTEYTEEDVTEEVKNEIHHLESPNIDPFKFPGLHSDIEAIEREIFGGLNNFLEAAEEMANGFFRSFSIPSLHDREPSPFVEDNQRERKNQIGIGEKNDNGPAYSGLSGDIRDV